MGILGGNPKEQPLHYGEVFGTWSYLTVNKGLISLYEGFINHAGDRELKKLLEEAIVAMKGENELVEELLLIHGIGLPPTPPERPAADLEEIPVGAKFMDIEISAVVSANAAQGLVACSMVMGQSTREDVATMFGQFHMNKALFGAKMLKLNKEKGWLVPPPLHFNTSSHNE